MAFGVSMLLLPALVAADGQPNSTSHVAGALALTVSSAGDVSSLGPA